MKILHILLAPFKALFSLLGRIRLKYWVVFLVLLILLSPIWYYAGYHIYRWFDVMKFPGNGTTYDAGIPEKEKGVIITKTLVEQLEWELNSPFGWSGNDINPITRLMDNRANRQKGVRYASLMYTEYFAQHFAKLGANDAEDEELKKARETYLMLSPDKFWFPSAEGSYKRAIKLIKGYADRLGQGKATYNVRTDDLFTFLEFTTGEKLMGYALGLLLENNENVSWFKLDDYMEEAKGISLVIRDMVRVVSELYPEMEQKGGARNLEVAMTNLDKICIFDPILVTAGKGDSLVADHRRKLAGYLMFARDRIQDVQQSMRR